MEDVSLWLLERVAKMPRQHRFTLGDRLVETSLEATTLLLDASYVRDKHGLLLAAGRALTRLRLLGRLGRRLGVFSEKQELFLAQQTSEASRMVGGWARAQRGRGQAPAPQQASRSSLEGSGRRPAREPPIA